MPGGALKTYIAPRTPMEPAVFRVNHDDVSTMIAVDPANGKVLGDWERRNALYDLANKIHGTFMIGDIGDRLIEIAAGFGIVLWVADRVARNRYELTQLTWWDGIALGFAQALALIPGVSRSGATIAGGLFLGYKREAATRYAFLLAIPAVFISGLFKLKDIPHDPTLSWPPTIVATVLAFGIGLAVIHWLLRYVSKHSFSIFVWYRLALAALVAGLLAGGVLQP